MFEGTKNRWSCVLLFLLGASFCFVQLGVTAFGRFWTIGSIVTALYLGFTFAEFLRNLKRIREHRKYVVLPLTWIGLLILVNGLNYNELNDIPIVNTTIAMCFVLYVFILLHIKRDTVAYRFLLNGFVVGNIIMSLLFLAGIGVEIDPYKMRLQMFGSNANQLGIYMSYSIIIIINGWLLNDNLKISAFRWLLIPLLIPQISLLFATASRTAFSIVVVAIIVGVLLYKMKSKIARVFIITLGILAAVYGYKSFIDSDMAIATRMQNTLEDDDTSGRSDIVTALLPYALDNFFFGVGETGYVDIAKYGLGEIKVLEDGSIRGFSPHNVLLEVLLYTGILGFVIMLLFWGSIAKCAYDIYRCSGDSTLLLCLIPIIGCLVSGQLLGDKIAWVLYACIIAVRYAYIRK